MADLDRYVETRFGIKDEMSAKLDDLQKAMDKLTESHKKNEKATEHLGEKFAGAQEKLEGLKEKAQELATVFGVGLGLKAIAERFIHANAEAESLTKRLSALVAANYDYANSAGKMDPAANFKRSMQTGAEMFAKFQGASVQYGLKQNSLTEAAAEMLPAFAKAKLSTKEVGDQIIMLGRLSALTGEDLDGTARALNMFLQTGGVMHRNPIFGMLGLTKMDESKTSPEQRAETLRKAIEKFPLGFAAGVTTFGGLIDKIKARFDALFQEAGKPLFEEAKIKAEQLNKWLEKNKDNIVTAGRELANHFGKSLDTAAKLMAFAAKHATVLKDALLALVATNKINSMFGGINEALSKWGNVKVGGDTDINKMGGVFGKAVGFAMVAQAALIGYAIGTAINDWLGTQPWFNKLMTPGATAGEKSADRDELKRKADDILREQALRKMLMGNNNLGNRTQAEQADYVLNGLEKHGTKSLMLDENHNLTATYSQIQAFAIRNGLMAPLPSLKTGASGDVEKPKGMTQIFNNARFDVTQNFAENFDPDRIAVAFGNEIASMGERRLQSGFAPILGVR